MNIFRFCYVAVSFLLLIAIYLINHSITIGLIMNDVGVHPCIDLPNWVSYVIYLAMVILSSWLLTKKFNVLNDRINLEADQIGRISPTGDNFLASFFAYIFLGLSISNLYMLAVIFMALVIMCYSTQMYLYNPLFILFEYNYYYIKTPNGLTIILLTKQKFGLGEIDALKGIRRLNDYTYIDS